MKLRSRVPVALLAALSLTVVSYADDKKKDPDDIGNRDVGKGVNFYSLEKEIALGKQLAQEVERQAKIVDDPIIAEYVNRVGQNLVRNSDAKVPFTIKVLDSEEVNAFALPGGFFFVNSGLILKAESEAELAGVMAHEIAHVAARHGTRQATTGDLMQIATIAASIAMGGWTGYAIRQGAGLAIPMGFLTFSRAHEREADYLGLQYMYKAGYDPTAFVDFFEKIQTMEKKKPGIDFQGFLHPPDDRRPHQGRAGRDPEDPGAQAGIRREHLRVQRCEGPPGDAAQPPQGQADDPNRPRLRRAPGSGRDRSTTTPTARHQDRYRRAAHPETPRQRFGRRFVNRKPWFL